MEYSSIEREIHTDASPEVVFEVISSPEHISQWWSDDATVEPVPGSVGELVWGDRAEVVPITVVTAEPPRLFSFRWAYEDGKADPSAASLLVTFEITPSGSGADVKLIETGFHEMGWADAQLAEQHAQHSAGWGMFIPKLGEYLAKPVSIR